MQRFVMAAVCASWLVLAGCGGGGTGSGSNDRSSGSSSASAAPSASTSMPAASQYDKGPRASESDADEQLAAQGEKLFSTKGCTACHAFGKRVTGPDLAGVSMRRTAVWMENQILHPDKMVKEDPIARQLFATYALQMPNQGLTPEEAKAIIEYFKHRDHESNEDDEEDHK